MPQIENLVDKLVSRLPESGRNLFEYIRTGAESRGTPAYLVGGTVRDLLLDRVSLDIDVAIEGDAIALAKRLAEVTGLRVAKMTAFGTATLKSDGFRLDLATARAESYAKPGSLPEVRPAAIQDDLRRRDFTINAMAVRIQDGDLLDPADGRGDLRGGLIRVLHDRSFQDDATRIIRAVRYETRFAFQIEPHTLGLLRRDLRYLETISGTRLRQELARTLSEGSPERALLRLAELGVLSAIHPALRFGAEQASAFACLPALNAPPAAAWPLLLWTVDENMIPDISRRLSLPRAQATAVAAVPDGRLIAGRLASMTRASDLAHLIDRLPLATAYALAAITGDARLAWYLQEGRFRRSLLRGDDLVRLGVVEGPDIATVLALIRDAKLDGDVTTREDEERLVEQFLARERLGLG